MKNVVAIVCRLASRFMSRTDVRSRVQRVALRWMPMKLKMVVFRGVRLGELGCVTRFDIVIHDPHVRYLCVFGHENALALLEAKADECTSLPVGRSVKS